MPSIRSRLFAAFVAMGLLTAGLGIFAYYGIATAGRIVVDIYDRPLTAINFARSASLAFLQMNNAMLRERQGEGADGAIYRAKLREFYRNFAGDIAIAEERALTPQARRVVGEIRDQAKDWMALVIDPASMQDAARHRRIDFATSEIMQKFDLLIELTASESVSERTRAMKAIDWIEVVAVITTLVALVLSALVTYLLGRRIVRPLEQAARSANRIAAGEFDTTIPEGGRDETGVLLRSMRVMQDSIRAMVAREKEQKESALSRFADALENSSEAMLLVDADGRVVAASPQMGNYFPSAFPLMVPGAAFDEIFTRAGLRMERVGGPQGETLVPVDADGIAEALFGGGEFHVEGGRWLRVSRSRTREGGYFLFISDITDLKEREASLRIAKQEAETANEAKSNFLANMSHELRTPLNAIIGFSEIMSGDLLGSATNRRYREYSKDILTSGRQLLDVINSVLDIAKGQAETAEVEREEMKVSTLIDFAARVIAPQCEEAGLNFEVDDRSGGAIILCDEPKIRQVLLNLLSNAVKFTGADGRVTLAALPYGKEGIEFRVSDTGIGMTEEEIGVALEPFGQVDSSLARKYEGVGLGLSIAKVFVELHHGRLAIDSSPTRGTTVIVRLPRSGATADVHIFTPREARAD